MGKAKDSPEYLQYTQSRKSLMSAIWKTVSTEYENNRGRRKAEIERYSRTKQAGNQRIKNSLDSLERKTGKIIGDFLGVSKGNALLKSIFALPSGVEEKFKQFENFREET